MADEKGVTIVYEDVLVRAGLNALSKRLKNMRPVYRVISEIMKEAVDSNFVAEGARGGNPKWKPLAFATRLSRLNRKMGRGKSVFLKRRRAGRLRFRKKALRLMAPGGLKILQVTSRLRRSCAAGTSFNNHQASVGSNLEYARIHQLGGEAGRKGARVTIPARPYLFMTTSDIVEIESTIADMLVAEWDRA